MRNWISVQIEQTYPTLQFLVILLVMAASFFVWMSVMGCTDCDSESYYSTSVNTGKDSAPSLTARGMIRSNASAAYGGEIVSRRLQTRILLGEGQAVGCEPLLDDQCVAVPRLGPLQVASLRHYNAEVVERSGKVEAVRSQPPAHFHGPTVENLGCH